MPLPSLNAIRAFEAAARLSSFKLAAEELNLSQSAISRHIRSLETSLGVELFEREFRQVKLTGKAVYYARRVSEAFKTLHDATDEISARGPAQRRGTERVSLSINVTFMNLWLADRLPRFRASYPGYELEIAIHDDSGRGGNPRADLRILFSDDHDDDPALTKLISLIIIPVCAPSLTKGPNGLRSPKQLARHRLLHENTTAWWEEWIEGEGVSGVDAKQGAIFHDPSLAIREAVNGGGVALADNIMAEDLLARGQLVTPFPIRRRIASCYSLAIARSKASSIPTRQFRDWLTAEIEKHKKIMRMG